MIRISISYEVECVQCSRVVAVEKTKAEANRARIDHAEFHKAGAFTTEGASS